MNKLKELIGHFFIPGEKNNLRAKALHHDFLTFYLLVALIMVFLAKSPLGQFRNILGYATDINVTKLYQLTNEQRQSNNLAQLSYNEALAQAASAKAQDMLAKNYWAHYAPDGATPWNFILASGYQYEYAGENLAKNFLFSDNVLDAWMASPTHRENVLRSDFTDVGFAVVNGVLNGEQTTLVVQMFGKPAVPVAQVVTQATEAAKVIPATNAAAPPSGLVLAQQQTKPKINLFNLSFNTTFVFLSLLLIVLATDFYFASKFNVIRFHSKNIAHSIFLFTIFLGLLLFLSKGVIL
jgi:uncharacterized protein YkwD